MAACDNDTNKKKVIQILIDDRERNARLLLTLKEQGNTQVRTCRLAVGDYLLNNLLVERKSFADLCISIKDGRLFRQATQLASAGVQPLIILEGTFTDLKATAMTRETIQGALISLALVFKIPVLRSQSPEETAKLILYAAKQIEKAGFSRYVYPRPCPGKKSVTQKQKMQIYVLQGFPGIGPMRSKQLLNKFKTLAAIFTASPQALAEVPGISKRSVKRIFDLLN